MNINVKSGSFAAVGGMCGCAVHFAFAPQKYFLSRMERGPPQ